MDPTNITPLKNRGVFIVVEMEAEWGHTTYLSYSGKNRNIIVKKVPM